MYVKLKKIRKNDIQIEDAWLSKKNRSKYNSNGLFEKNRKKYYFANIWYFIGGSILAEYYFVEVKLLIFNDFFVVLINSDDESFIQE